MELTLGRKLYRAFRFILITLFIAYLFYTKDVWRFYFTPFYFGWYFFPFILKFIDHLEHVGMSPDDYPTSSSFHHSYPRYNNNSQSYEDFNEEKERDVSEYKAYEFIPNPKTYEERHHNKKAFYNYYAD